ncbi:MAG TPA: RNA polymerase sigma factor, partial [Spirochaetia bacterium]|nr:RNA polymerase sigma factor [Spirochaetia bacterium]
AMAFFRASGYDARMLILIIITEDEFDRLKNRDPEVLDRLYREFKKPIFNFCIIKSRGRHDIAEEIASETFCAMIASAPTLKNCRNIQNWLLQIASRKLADFFRKEFRERRKLQSLRHDYQVDAHSAAPPDVEGAMETRKILLLNLALENVREKYRRLLRLKYLEGTSLDEIARMDGVPATTVNGLLVRARRELKREALRIAKRWDI